MELGKSSISIDLSLDLGEISQGVNTLDFWYHDFLRLNPQAAAKIDNFLDRVWDHYGDSGLENIEKALKIATVGYQYNHKVEKRFRKEKDEQGKPIPTLYHSLEMAERLVRDNFNTVGVAAILLHDVPEDVKLEIVEDGYVRTIEGDQWYEIFAADFKDIGDPGLMIDLIKGLTEVELPDKNSQVGQEIRKRLDQSQLFKMIQAFVASGRIKGEMNKKAVYGEERELVYEVVYNLEFLFNEAFKSEEHLQLLILKITDIWHNLQTPDWVKPAKIMRGRLAASLAEWMGWYSMRSQIIESLAEITDTNRPYAPDISQKKTPITWEKNVSIYKQFATETMNYILNKLSLDFDEEKFLSGWPFISARDEFTSWKDTTLAPPEFIYMIPRGKYFELKDWLGEEEGYNLRGTVSRPGNIDKKSYYFGINQSMRDSSCFTRDMGRGRLDFKVSVGNYPSYILRVESDEPHIFDSFRNYSQIKLIEVPEARGLFNPKLRGTDHWNNHLTSLIGFFYDFNLPFNLGKGIFAVLDAGSFYFFDGQLTFRNVMEVLGYRRHKKIYGYWGHEFDDENILDKSLNTFEYKRRSKSFRNRVFILQ